MKYTKAFAALLLALLLCACAALADGTGTGIGGQADQITEFTVYAQANTRLVFSQDRGMVQRSTGLRSSIYGGYTITWYPTYQPAQAKTASLQTAENVTVPLTRYTSYTVRVEPMTLYALTARDAYLGLPGSYEKWITPAKWTLASADNCQIGAAPTATPVPYAYYHPTATPAPYYFNPTATPNYYFSPTAAPQPTATVYVYYRLTNGSLITFDMQSLAPGVHTINAKLNGSYFVPVGSTSQNVTVYSNGQASQTSVTFYYQYNSGGIFQPTAVPTATPSPTPQPTAVPQPAAVTVTYKLTDGTVLSTETRLLAEGAYLIAYDGRYDGLSWLQFIGPSSYQITAFGNGHASSESVTFFFGSTAAAPTALPTATPTPALQWDESATNQSALIGAAKIFPRPEPGKGKNTFNYEAEGQRVTVHSKAKSLKGDNNWWVCISGNLRCWGTDYVIDHEWIRVDYLNRWSFDIDKVPVDPRYPSL